MPIYITHSRRGLYTIEEYKTYRGEFRDSVTNSLIPLSESYKPIIYMKCHANSHQFPIRPEDGNIFIDYDVFLNMDLASYPVECPKCHDRTLTFKYCKLEDQPRTFNDLNHRHIKENRLIIDHPLSPYYAQDGPFIGIARPYYEDYFPPNQPIPGTLAPNNNKDPFAEHQVIEKTTTGFYSATTPITSPLPHITQLPLEDVYDYSHRFIDKKAGSDRPDMPAVPAFVGKYLKYRQNFDFYRAIVYITTQYFVE